MVGAIYTKALFESLRIMLDDIEYIFSMVEVIINVNSFINVWNDG